MAIPEQMVLGPPVHDVEQYVLRLAYGYDLKMLEDRSGEMRMDRPIVDSKVQTCQLDPLA